MIDEFIYTEQVLEDLEVKDIVNNPLCNFSGKLSIFSCKMLIVNQSGIINVFDYKYLSATK